MAVHVRSLLGVRAVSITLFLLLLFIGPQGALSLSFSECGEFVQDLINQGNSTVEDYIFKGTPRNLKPGRATPLLITTAGCERFCGNEIKYYDWPTISDTITTWVLPIAGGLILQAPFESTQWVSTILVLCRWLGNPISVLTCILWNVRTTRKCAQLCDMATSRNFLPGYPRRSMLQQLKGEWKRILEESVIGAHQSSSKSWPDLDKLEEEKIEGHDVDDVSAFAELRDSLYIICILNQYAFDRSNPQGVRRVLWTALFSRDSYLVEKRKKLAAKLRSGRKHGVVQVLISLLWFVVALVISIYKAFGDLGDESTALNLALGLLLGWLPAIIASSLVDQNPSNTTTAKEKLQKFLDQAGDTISGNKARPELLAYCGQARRRWHYGVAYPLLTDFQLHLQSRKRGLIRFYQDGSMSDFENNGLPLWFFNPIEFWQMLSAIILVGSATMGAVIISYNTPTVGLGCRSGGYAIYGILIFAAFLVEFAGWTADKPEDLRPSLRRRYTFYAIRGFMTLIEVTNCSWLIYSIIGQTWGIFNTCKCRSSDWDGRGGYATLSNQESYQRDFVVLPYWIAGTVLGMLPLIAILTIVYQWCTQAFLATESYENAMRGLRRVRAWKYVSHLDFVHSLFTFGPDRVRSRKLGQKFRSVTWKR